MLVKKIVLVLLSIAVVAFVGACGAAAPDTANAPAAPAAPKEPAQKEAEPAPPPAAGAAAAVPEDKTLRVTVPKMARVKGGTFPDAAGDDEEALKQNPGIHLRGTGFPWEEGANVYLAGHRLGYPNTDSFLAFWDLDALENGDEVTVTDANGKDYVYEVYKEFVVEPTDLYVTEPVPGRSILTLQTCTLPDYSKRLIVQAELKS